MALTKEQKKTVIDQVGELLDQSKMTVIAKYQGTSVQALQQLRRDAKANGTTVKVIKNRLVKQAISASDKFKDIDVSELEGMLLYAFNSEDEVAAAQVLNNFAKQNPNLEFVSAISSEAKLLDAIEVKQLAGLPGKSQLLADLISALASPLQGVMGGLSGNLSAILAGLETKASN